MPLTALFISACSYIESTESNAAPSEDSTVAIKQSDTGTLQSYNCLTFGYRNWSLQRDGETITLSGEASMPTPAWSIALHQNTKVDNSTIEFVIETIEPSGLSSSVISWVGFETTASAAATTNVVVSCAGDIVWNSLDS